MPPLSMTARAATLDAAPMGILDSGRYGIGLVLSSAVPVVDAGWRLLRHVGCKRGPRPQAGTRNRPWIAVLLWTCNTNTKKGIRETCHRVCVLPYHVRETQKTQYYKPNSAQKVTTYKRESWHGVATFSRLSQTRGIRSQGVAEEGWSMEE